MLFLMCHSAIISFYCTTHRLYAYVLEMFTGMGFPLYLNEFGV